MTYKVSYFQKITNQLMILISTSESGDLVRSRNVIMDGECSYGMVGAQLVNYTYQKIILVLHMHLLLQSKSTHVTYDINYN